jgi:hypothetical protein
VSEEKKPRDNIKDCIYMEYMLISAEIAQLGEQQTEVLKVACSIHALGISILWKS